MSNKDHWVCSYPLISSPALNFHSHLQLLPPGQATFSEVFEDKERKCMEMRYLIGCVSCVSRLIWGCGPYVKSYQLFKHNRHFCWWICKVPMISCGVFVLKFVGPSLHLWRQARVVTAGEDQTAIYFVKKGQLQIYTSIAGSTCQSQLVNCTQIIRFGRAWLSDMVRWTYWIFWWFCWGPSVLPKLRGTFRIFSP